MSCPICGARTNGKCQQCRMQDRLEREDPNAGTTRWDPEVDDE